MSTILSKKELRSQVADKLMEIFAGFKEELGEKKFEKNIKKACKNLTDGLKHADEDEEKETVKKTVVKKAAQKTAKAAPKKTAPKKAAKKTAVKKTGKKSPAKKAASKSK